MEFMMSPDRLLYFWGPETEKAFAPVSVHPNSVSVSQSSRVDDLWAVLRFKNTVPFRHDSLFGVLKTPIASFSTRRSLMLNPAEFIWQGRHVIVSHICREVRSAVNIVQQRFLTLSPYDRAVVWMRKDQSIDYKDPRIRIEFIFGSIEEHECPILSGAKFFQMVFEGDICDQAKLPDFLHC